MADMHEINMKMLERAHSISNSTTRVIELSQNMSSAEDVTVDELREIIESLTELAVVQRDCIKDLVEAQMEFVDKLEKKLEDE